MRGQLKKSLYTLPAVAGVIFGAAGFTWSAPAPKMIDHAIGLFVTEHGQKHIYNNFNEILVRNGFSMSEGAFPYFKAEMDEPLTMNSLRELLSERPNDPNARATVESIENIRAATARWLRGFRVNDPRFRIKVLNLAYQVRFTRFGIRADKAATDRLQTKRGIVLVAEAEIPELHVSVKRIQVNDWSNEFLGNMGVSNLWAGFKNEEVPLQLHMPVSITIDDKGMVALQALPMTTNIDTIQLNSGFDRPLSLPDIRIRINGREGVVDKTQIENELARQSGPLLKALQSYLREFASDKLPSILNNRIAEAYNPNEGEVDVLDPPGGPSGIAPDQKYQWGMHVSDVAMTQSSALYFELGAFVEDPTVEQKALPALERGLQAPNFESSKGSKADIGIAINENLLNRALQLSFNRGYFDKIPLSKDESIKLVSSPYIVLDGSKGANRAVLRLDVNYKLTNWVARNFAVRNPLHMKMNLVLRLVKTPKGMKIVQEAIDLDSLWIDPASLRRWGLSKTVYKGVKEILGKTNKGYKENESLLTEEVPLPEALYGVPLELKEFESKDGYMKLFLNLGGRK